jgi:hypothetical protein
VRPVGVEHRIPTFGVGCDEQTRKMRQMGDKIRSPVPGSLQGNCSKWSTRGSPTQGAGFGGSRRSERRIGAHSTAYGLERLDVWRWAWARPGPAIVEATPFPSSIRKGSVGGGRLPVRYVESS